MSKMTESGTLIAELRERLENLFAGWGTDLSSLLIELEEKCASVEEFDTTTDEQAQELEATRADLDACKALIRRLRADADRAKKLEQQLDEKRAVIKQLEASVDHYVRSLLEMRQAVATWKQRATGVAVGSDAISVTSTGLRALTDEELEVLRNLEDIDHDIGEATITFDLTDKERAGPKITTNR